MATFEFQALTATGKKQKGQMEADSARQVRQRLREEGLTPLAVESVTEATQKPAFQLLQSKIKTADLALVIRQLYTLLSAGKPLAEALHTVAKQSETKRVRRFLTGLYQAVSEGHSFAQALRQSPFQVPEELIATVAAGEESGHLEHVLSRLADTIELQEKLAKKMKSALIYPSVMVAVALSIVVFLITFVVPKLTQAFSSLDRALPPLTQGLIDVSDFMQSHWLALLLGLVGVIGIYRALMQRPQWRERIQRFWLRMPLIRRFLIYATSARWARTLGVLLESGVPALEALRISSEVITLLPLKKRVEAMREQVRKGSAISQAMKEAQFFPPLLISLVETGEGNGQVAQMLIKGAERYEEDVATSAQTLLALLEPLLIVVMGGIVLVIVLAIMMPIFEMNQLGNL
jgi:general secretion pathway protein F